MLRGCSMVTGAYEASGEAKKTHLDVDPAVWDDIAKDGERYRSLRKSQTKKTLAWSTLGFAVFVAFMAYFKHQLVPEMLSVSNRNTNFIMPDIAHVHLFATCPQIRVDSKHPEEQGDYQWYFSDGDGRALVANITTHNPEAFAVSTNKARVPRSFALGPTENLNYFLLNFIDGNLKDNRGVLRVGVIANLSFFGIFNYENLDSFTELFLSGLRLSRFVADARALGEQRQALLHLSQKNETKTKKTLSDLISPNFKWFNVSFLSDASIALSTFVVYNNPVENNWTTVPTLEGVHNLSFSVELGDKKEPAVVNLTIHKLNIFGGLQHEMEPKLVLKPSSGWPELFNQAKFLYEHIDFRMPSFFSNASEIPCSMNINTDKVHAAVVGPYILYSDDSLSNAHMRRPMLAQWFSEIMADAKFDIIEFLPDPVRDYKNCLLCRAFIDGAFEIEAFPPCESNSTSPTVLSSDFFGPILKILKHVTLLDRAQDIKIFVNYIQIQIEQELEIYVQQIKNNPISKYLLTNFSLTSEDLLPSLTLELLDSKSLPSNKFIIGLKTAEVTHNLETKKSRARVDAYISFSETKNQNNGRQTQYNDIPRLLQDTFIRFSELGLRSPASLSEKTFISFLDYSKTIPTHNIILMLAKNFGTDLKDFFASVQSGQKMFDKNIFEMRSLEAFFEAEKPAVTLSIHCKTSIPTSYLNILQLVRIKITSDIFVTIKLLDNLEVEYLTDSNWNVVSAKIQIFIEAKTPSLLDAAHLLCATSNVQIIDIKLSGGFSNVENIVKPVINFILDQVDFKKIFISNVFNCDTLKPFGKTNEAKDKLTSFGISLDSFFDIFSEMIVRQNTNGPKPSPMFDFPVAIKFASIRATFDLLDSINKAPATSEKHPLLASVSLVLHNASLDLHKMFFTLEDAELTDLNMPSLEFTENIIDAKSYLQAHHLVRVKLMPFGIKAKSIKTENSPRDAIDFVLQAQIPALSLLKLSDASSEKMFLSALDNIAIQSVKLYELEQKGSVIALNLKLKIAVPQNFNITVKNVSFVFNAADKHLFTFSMLDFYVVSHGYSEVSASFALLVSEKFTEVIKTLKLSEEIQLAALGSGLATYSLQTPVPLFSQTKKIKGDNIFESEYLQTNMATSVLEAFETSIINSLLAFSVRDIKVALDDATSTLTLTANGDNLANKVHANLMFLANGTFDHALNLSASGHFVFTEHKWYTKISLCIKQLHEARDQLDISSTIQENVVKMHINSLKAGSPVQGAQDAEEKLHIVAENIDGKDLNDVIFNVLLQDVSTEKISVVKSAGDSVLGRTMNFVTSIFTGALAGLQSSYYYHNVKLTQPNYDNAILVDVHANRLANNDETKDMLNLEAQMAFNLNLRFKRHKEDDSKAHLSVRGLMSITRSLARVELEAKSSTSTDEAEPFGNFYDAYLSHRTRNFERKFVLSVENVELSGIVFVKNDANATLYSIGGENQPKTPNQPNALGSISKVFNIELKKIEGRPNFICHRASSQTEVTSSQISEFAVSRLQKKEHWYEDVSDSVGFPNVFRVVEHSLALIPIRIYYTYQTHENLTLEVAPASLEFIGKSGSTMGRVRTTMHFFSRGGKVWHEKSSGCSSWLSSDVPEGCFSQAINAKIGAFMLFSSATLPT